MTLQKYYEWNQIGLKKHINFKKYWWIYLVCDWPSSSMYYGLLSNKFIIQNRITWHNRNAKDRYRHNLEKSVGDIWFATKSDDFLFNNRAVSLKSDRVTSLMTEIISYKQIFGLIFQQLKSPFQETQISYLLDSRGK